MNNKLLIPGELRFGLIGADPGGKKRMEIGVGRGDMLAGYVYLHDCGSSVFEPAKDCPALTEETIGFIKTIMSHQKQIYKDLVKEKKGHE